MIGTFLTCLSLVMYDLCVCFLTTVCIICLRKILHVTYRDQITREEIIHRAGSRRLSDTVAFRMAGHVYVFQVSGLHG